MSSIVSLSKTTLYSYETLPCRLVDLLEFGEPSYDTGRFTSFLFKYDACSIVTLDSEAAYTSRIRTRLASRILRDQFTTSVAGPNPGPGLPSEVPHRPSTWNVLRPLFVLFEEGRLLSGRV